MIISIKQKIALLLIVFLSAHALASNLVGSIEGEANSNMGVLNYKIPLELPEGANGIRPVIGIKYNSAVNSGFSIYGTSVISRCSASKEIDGFIGRVNFDNFDKYCLDGSRLIATSRQAGEVDTTYSNRVKNFSRITSVGGNTNNSDSWKIETKDGYVLYYGVDSNSKNAQDQGNYRWYLSSKEDRFGNKISYVYKNQAGKTVLDAINYSIHSVQFVYQTVGQSIKKYEYGATYYDNEVLKRVEVKTNNTLRRAYNFDYEIVGVSNIVRLKKLELCDGENNCTKPTAFDWHQADNTNPMLRKDKTIFTGSKKFLSYQLIDVTADGQAEVCYPDYNGYIVCGSKKSSIGKSFSNLKKTLSTLQFNNLNHDGYADYCLSDESSGTYCAINKGDGSFTSISKWSNNNSSDDSNFRYLDINADKYTDLCIQNKTSLNCFLNNQGNSFNDVLSFNIAFNDPKKTFFTDINGDGASDVCGIDNGFSCYLNTSIKNKISFSTKKVWSNNSSFTSNHNIVKDSLRITDFNNDGSA